MTWDSPLDVGRFVGDEVGDEVGPLDGLEVGASVGAAVGLPVGLSVGVLVGDGLGRAVGVGVEHTLQQSMLSKQTLPPNVKSPMCSPVISLGPQQFSRHTLQQLIPPKTQTMPPISNSPSWASVIVLQQSCGVGTEVDSSAVGMSVEIGLVGRGPKKLLFPLVGNMVGAWATGVVSVIAIVISIDCPALSFIYGTALICNDVVKSLR